jgi:zinc transport system ATP-binding protein
MVLESVHLDINEGEFVGVVGPNAGGKSTLLKLMLGLLPPTRGKVSVAGRPPQQATRMMGYVPQFPAFGRDFPITVEQTVLLGRLGVTRWWGGWSRADRESIRNVMERTEIAPLARRQLGTLSGGQLQRVLLARALACEPALLLLDEPTANIDMRSESDIFDLLKELNRKMTIVVVSHDVGFISQYVTRVACLNRTLICCHPTYELDGRTIKQLYGDAVQMVGHSHD